jgi:homocysteine S-methyltransferase
VLVGTTMTSIAESIGLVRAASETGLPVIVSPTVETDGRLPDASPPGDFVRRVDDATGGAPLFYMVNCAHPTHVRPTLERAAGEGAGWLGRFAGFRANASARSHAELDESPELDRGDPEALAGELADLKRRFGLRVGGGCCGTDAEHIAAIAAATAAG